MRDSLKSKVFGFCAAAVLLLSPVSCRSATPATRIAENPVLFRSLPEAQQQLVQQGRIAEGMSQDAVFLAWGAPNTAPYVGQKNGKSVIRWVYTYNEPVPVTSNWGPGWWGPYGGWYGPYGIDTGTAYIPRTAASVLFENNKVVSWEQRNKP